MLITVTVMPISPESYFSNFNSVTQKRYEMLKMIYRKDISLDGAAEKFGLSKNYVKKCKHEFYYNLRNDIDPFFAVRKTGPKKRRTKLGVIKRIVDLRKKNNAITDIKAVLNAQNIKLSYDTIDKILKSEGFAPLPKRTKQERMSTLIPKLTAPQCIPLLIQDEEFSTEVGGGLLSFLPVIEEMGIIEAIKNSNFPKTSQISDVASVLSFLALKLTGGKRWSHDTGWNLDRAFGLFAGLNVLPKSTTLSTYSYRVSRKSNMSLLRQLANIFDSDNGCIFYTMLKYKKEKVAALVQEYGLVILKSDKANRIFYPGSSEVSELKVDDKKYEQHKEILTKMTKINIINNGQYQPDDFNLELDKVKNLVSYLGCDHKGEFNLDFKTIPHFGDDSVLEKNWSGSKRKVMKSILSLIVHNPDTGFMSYTDTGIKRKNESDAVIEFVDFWKEAKGTSPKMLVFDSKFTAYQNLNKLNKNNIKFLTLRRRGNKLIEQSKDLEWQTITIPRTKKRKQKIKIHDRKTALHHYEGDVREIIITDHGREKPTFLITNDMISDVKTIVHKYAKRWLVEQEIAEQIDFFHLNSPSSSIVVKVDFDLTISLLAHNLYRVLASKLTGFENCQAQTLHRKFIDGGASIEIKDRVANIKIKKKTHLPILFQGDWIKNNFKSNRLGIEFKFSQHSTS